MVLPFTIPKKCFNGVSSSLMASNTSVIFFFSLASQSTRALSTVDLQRLLKSFMPFEKFCCCSLLAQSSTIVSTNKCAEISLAPGVLVLGMMISHNSASMASSAAETEIFFSNRLALLRSSKQDGMMAIPTETKASCFKAFRREKFVIWTR